MPSTSLSAFLLLNSMLEVSFSEIEVAEEREMR
jgi:hypothetical protein